MVIMFNSCALDAVVLIGAALAALYYYLASTYNHWKNKGVNFLKPTLIFGNRKRSTLMQISTAEEFQEFYYNFKGEVYGGIFEGIIPTLIIRDPELIKGILVKDFKYFQDRNVMIDDAINPLEAHLFHLRGSRWRALRSKLTPTFTSGKVKFMFHLIEACGLELVGYLEGAASNGETIEIRDALARYSTDVIGTCAFGLQCNSMKNPHSEFRRMGIKIFDPPLANRINRLVMFVLPKLAKLLRLKFAANDVTNFFLRVVKETVAYREHNNVVQNDFLQLLIELKNASKAIGGRVEEDGIELTEELLAAQAYVFFFAGFETSSTTMSFCLMELARHPDIQVRLQEEIDSVLEDYDGKLTYDGIQRMEYLDKVVYEALRKFPPVPVLSRTCTIPYTIPGSNVRLDPGARVIIPIHAIQNDPEHYPDPERFDPDRFSEENKRTRHSFTFLPFGNGPRVCIGARFGMVQTKVGLVSLLANYDVRLGEMMKFPLLFDPRSDVLFAKGGIHLKLTKRT